MASASPRRKRLLQKLDISFIIHSSSLKEGIRREEKPEDAVQRLAFQKAEDVGKNYSKALILGADTVVVLNDEIIGKPADKQEAETILKKLSGQTHRVLTGVALIKTDEKGGINGKKLFYEETFVTFGTLHSTTVKKYINIGSPMDKAGGYGIQDDLSAAFVKQIKGDYYNVMSLPLYSLYRHLKTIFSGNFKQLI